MKRPLFEKRTAIDQERIERIEDVVTRLARRSRKIAKAIVTPYPISNAIIGDDLIGNSLEGIILRYIFPCKGKITGGYIRLDNRPKGGATINVKIFNDAKSECKGFTIDKKIISVSTELDVDAGDCLEISLTPIGESIIKEIWISMLWVPTSGDVQQFLIDELEKNLDEFIEEIEE